jgi:DNA (cytosine-5)-methyltransferase 1
MKEMTQQPLFLVVDLFCGAGGTSTGFLQSGVAKVVACVNHDHYAILSHYQNHSEVKHFEEDIREVSMPGLQAVVVSEQMRYPDARLILWASLECTNFSKAKGGLARDADSRTLADHLHRYITCLQPDFVMIENVVEFMDWGPLRVKMKNGNPVKIKNKHGEVVEGFEPVPECKGQDFNRWRKEVCAHGYVDEWRQMNSADYGAYTSRNRLFGMFARTAEELVWPEPTHSKTGKNGLLKWNAVKEKLDFSDEGYSIFYRGHNMAIPKRQRKDLSEKTLERVYAGCIKHIAGGKKAFMIKYHGGKPRTNHLDKPLTVIDTENRHAMVSASFISKYYSGEPYNKNISVEGPAGTIKTADGQALVNASFLSVYHGNGDNTFGVDDPAPTIAAADINAMVQAHLIDGTHFNAVPTSVTAPAGTLTADRHYPYLLTLQYGGHITDTDRPAGVILASGDKTPIYLLITEMGDVVIPVYDTDSEIVRKLKEFMALYRIKDIKMRMLRTPELLEIQGFPKGYILAGTQSDQKKFIGNSVVPQVVDAWARAMATHIIDNLKVA